MERTMQTEMKTVNILLTKYSDVLSMLLYYLTGRGYTHVSISLQDDHECYYSFNWKGFALETIEKYRRRGVTESMCFQLEVTEYEYIIMKERIREFEEN